MGFDPSTRGILNRSIWAFEEMLWHMALDVNKYPFPARHKFKVWHQMFKAARSTPPMRSAFAPEHLRALVRAVNRVNKCAEHHCAEDWAKAIKPKLICVTDSMVRFVNDETWRKSREVVRGLRRELYFCMEMLRARIQPDCTDERTAQLRCKYNTYADLLDKMRRASNAANEVEVARAVIATIDSGHEDNFKERGKILGDGENSLRRAAERFLRFTRNGIVMLKRMNSA